VGHSNCVTLHFSAERSNVINLLHVVAFLVYKVHSECLIPGIRFIIYQMSCNGMSRLTMTGHRRHHLHRVTWQLRWMVTFWRMTAARHQAAEHAMATDCRTIFTEVNSILKRRDIVSDLMNFTHSRERYSSCMSTVHTVCVRDSHVQNGSKWPHTLFCWSFPDECGLANFIWFFALPWFYLFIYYLFIYVSIHKVQ